MSFFRSAIQGICPETCEVAGTKASQPTVQPSARTLVLSWPTARRYHPTHELSSAMVCGQRLTAAAEHLGGSKRTAAVIKRLPAREPRFGGGC